MNTALLLFLAAALIAAYAGLRRRRRQRWHIISGYAVRLPLPAHPQATPRPRWQLQLRHAARARSAT